MDKFDQIKIGDKAEIYHVITEDDIKKFVELTGDDNKIHIDKEYASKTSFKKPVAHGMLGASFISTIIGTKIPGDGALWFSQTLEFLLPVRVGDKIFITAEVTSKLDRDKIIELRTDIHNQFKQKVTSGIAKVKIVEQLLDEVTNEIPEYKPKTILVIGATGGIGQAVCRKLAQDGHQIIINYHQNKEAAEQLKLDIESLNTKACIISGAINTDKDAIEIINKAKRTFNTIDGFVNCSTVKISNMKFENISWEDLDSHINVNIKSNFFILKHLVGNMKANRWGKIVFITTQYTESTPPAELLHYVTAKSALNGFAKSLAVECAPFNITVNLVSPGMTETDLISIVPEKTRLVTAAKTPLRRLAKTDDVANMISFLLSENANYITGQTMRVNGGQNML